MSCWIPIDPRRKILSSRLFSNITALEDGSTDCIIYSLRRSFQYDLFFIFLQSGGHKEFHSRHKDMCDNSLLPAPLVASCPPDVDRESMDTHPLTKVLPFLYLGNSKDADDRDGMTAIGVTRVLNVTTSQQSPSPTMDHRASGVVYKRLSVLDNGHANLKQYFEEAFEFIGK